ncbi:MAG TPA: 1,4-alpha-glucan branching protein GlgB [Candidatus Binataceae bacterium]|nr:1,4-alpha-glucan branching protein GlgB [Candidatus Binataceae bacterium]
MNNATEGVPQDELRRLLQLRHADPHAILGAHLDQGGVTIRAWRPGATAMAVITDEGREPMAPWSAADGLFTASFPGRHEVFAYKLAATYPNGRTETFFDPYSFLPTIGDLDQLLWNQGRHERIAEKLGAHLLQLGDVEGVGFAVWAPNAAGVSVVGDFNHWDGRIHMMRSLGASGIWEIFVPGLGAGEKYKFEIRTADHMMLKADPFAAATELPPATASIVYRRSYQFADADWLEARRRRDLTRSPMTIYEVHLGSWRRVPEEQDRSLTYRELAATLGRYVADMGFTHVELLPVMEHPFSGSWGYQVTGYFAPTARFGTPDDFRFFVDELHRQGVGVILDWVPAHFPTDAFSLGRFDGTALYEHLDPTQGFHPEWNTYIFNYGRNEVRNFLVASALTWLRDFHADGLRVDAVASMLYLDYARRPGQWRPNRYGGNENLEALEFIKQMNETVYRDQPGITMIAEESTAWPGISRPVYAGGLGFGFKWDMGWMHDTLNYFSRDPIHRRYHHRDITFGFLYAWSENFILPLSHDEVVYGKASMLSKMPGDEWQKFANLRALYGYMWARPGKKMLFMGSEFGQWREWDHDHSLDWHLLNDESHRKLQAMVRELNRLYRAEPALWEADSEPAGFHFIDADNADDNVIAFMRMTPHSPARRILCVCNFAPVVREGYRVGVPTLGWYPEILNTDSELFGGSNVGNGGGVAAEPIPHHGLAASISLRLPPLGVLWLGVP